MHEMKIPLAKPWFDENEPQEAYDVVKSGWLFMGPKVEKFEREFAAMLGVKHAIAVNSGSTALLMTLMALGIKPGDEVLVPDMTFISTASCASILGAIPKFVDITEDTYCMDPADLEKKISDKTRAIIPVHYAGQTADMDSIGALAKNSDIPIIEDAAEAHLACFNGIPAGTIGSVGIFSFTPSKPMTTGEGGMLVTNDAGLAEQLRLIRNYGDKGKFEWVTLGYNFRMMDIQGAIGLTQLMKLKKSVQLRREIASRYNDAFIKTEGIVTPYVRNPGDINFQLYTIRIRSDLLSITRNQFIEELGKTGIAARLYFPALHRAPVFAELNPGEDPAFPMASQFADTALSLPIYPTMSGEEIEFVISGVQKIVEKYRCA
jgi:perosamine synthetase